MRAALGPILFFLLLTLGGCITPHKLEVQQGNVVTTEMLEKLKPGMTKTQVRFVLGTPLIADPFHPERWDYVHVYKKHARAAAETRQLTVIFDGDALVRVEGDLAANLDFPSDPPRPANAPGTGKSARVTPDAEAPAVAASP